MLLGKLLNFKFFNGFFCSGRDAEQLYVKCPCNVTHDSVTLIFTFLIIIIGHKK